MLNFSASLFWLWKVSFQSGLNFYPASKEDRQTDHFSSLTTEIIKLWVFTLILTWDRDTNKLRNIFTAANKITETSLVTELEQWRQCYIGRVEVTACKVVSMRYFLCAIFLKIETNNFIFHHALFDSTQAT